MVVKINSKMKSIIIILLTLLSYSASNSQSKNEILIASCCVEGRGCTGSSYCTACKNCTGCKHCAKNGGSCGVCSSGKSYTSSKRKKKKTSLYKSINSVKYSVSENLIVISETLNLRDGPSTNYKILKRLLKNEKLTVLEDFGSWIKVEVEKTKLIGYVFSKYVKPH